MGNKDKPPLQNSFLDPDEVIEFPAQENTFSSFSFIGNIIGGRAKDFLSNDSKRNRASSKNPNPNKTKRTKNATMDKLEESSTMLFTLSRKVFLDDPPGVHGIDRPFHDPTTRKLENANKNGQTHVPPNSANNRNNYIDLHSNLELNLANCKLDGPGIASYTDVQTIEKEEIRNQSPLFVRSDVSLNVVSDPILPVCPGTLTSDSKNIKSHNQKRFSLEPIDQTDTPELPQTNVSSESDRFGSSKESSRSSKLDGSKFSPTRNNPLLLEESEKPSDTSVLVEVHDSKKITRKKGSGSGRTSGKTSSSLSMSARLSRFRGKQQNISDLNDISKENFNGPVPFQVEDLRNSSAWHSSTNRRAHLEHPNANISNSPDVATTTYESSAAIRQLQLNEINEASPDNEDDEAFKDDVLELADSRKNSADGEDSRNVFVHTETENTERSRWMDRLPAHLKEIPLHHLFIPGSHDSFSYSLQWGAPGPDVARSIRILSAVVPCLARAGFMRWSVTQKKNLSEQLLNGIRYFDIRVAEKNGQFYFVHGLYGELIENILIEMSTFLLSHPGEVCLLDFQHLYDFKRDSHTRLQSLIKSVFQDLLCPFQGVVDHVNLNYMEEYKYQVLVFYRSKPEHIEDEPVLWSSEFLPNPWPQTTDVEDMLEFIGLKLQDRDRHKFYVTQCVMTPSPSYVFNNMRSSLEIKLARPANRATLAALPNLANKEGGANVIMADFVEFEDYALPRAIINKNFELYSE